MRIWFQWGKISGTLLEDEVCFIVAGDKDVLRVKWYRAAGIAEELIKLRERAALLRYAYIVYIVLNAHNR